GFLGFFPKRMSKSVSPVPKREPVESESLKGKPQKLLPINKISRLWRDPKDRRNNCLKMLKIPLKKRTRNSTYRPAALVCPATISEPADLMRADSLIVPLHKNYQFSGQDSKRWLQIGLYEVSHFVLLRANISKIIQSFAFANSILTSNRLF